MNQNQNSNPNPGRGPGIGNQSELMAKLNRRSALLASGGNSPLVNPQQTNPNPNLPPQNSAPMRQGPPPVPVRNIGQQPVPSHGSFPQRRPEGSSINFTAPPLQNLNSDPNPATPTPTPLPNIPSKVKPQTPIQAQLPPPPEEDDFVPPPPPEEDDFPQEEIAPPLPTRPSFPKGNNPNPMRMNPNPANTVNLNLVRPNPVNSNPNAPETKISLRKSLNSNPTPSNAPSQLPNPLPVQQSNSAPILLPDQLPNSVPEQLEQSSTSQKRCDRCDGTAVVTCSECAVAYCSTCDNEVHYKGKWAVHVRFPITDEVNPPPLTKPKSISEISIPNPNPIPAPTSIPNPTPNPTPNENSSKVNKAIFIPLPGQVPVNQIQMNQTPVIPSTPSPAPPQEIKITNAPKKISHNMEIPLPNNRPVMLNQPPNLQQPTNPQSPKNRPPSVILNQPLNLQSIPQSPGLRGSININEDPKASLKVPGKLNLSQVPNIPMGIPMPSPTKNKQLSDSAWLDILNAFESEWTFEMILGCSNTQDFQRLTHHLQQLLNVKGLEKRLKSLESKKVAFLFSCLAATISKKDTFV